MQGFKEIFIEKFEDGIKRGEIKSILDLGSGLSRSFVPLLEKYPKLIYVGVEPSLKDAQAARENLASFKSAEVINSNGYEPIRERWGDFDLVISLSVLEHVKQIDKFLENSVNAARPGGQVVHRWDLGHALYPSSLKERLQVWLGNYLPRILPEHKFVRMLSPKEVEGKLASLGVDIDRTTYHQMPNHKSLLKHLSPELGAEAQSLIRKMVEWEFEASPHLYSVPEITRLKLFPTAAVWGRKKI